ncbi:cytochrome oxidase subunit III [Candidatus Woesearchaeota archaeon]|nr:cytochrome oxidase subunit III [Candidatus Woesearchaeota archaeon]
MNSKKFEMAGWVLFIICAILFIISGFRSYDSLLIIGSFIFLFACFVFLVPLVKK